MFPYESYPDVMFPDDLNPTLASVIGVNVRRLRGTYTMENLAAQARALGVRWSTGSVGSIEAGRFKATLDNLVILAIALGRLHGTEPVSFKELIKANVAMDLPGHLLAYDYQIAEWLAGEKLDVLRFPVLSKVVGEVHGGLMVTPRSLNRPEDNELGGAITPGEERLAKKAGLHVDELREWSQKLWGTTFEARRDDIAGAGSTPQKKGRVSRELLNEIETAMNDKG